MAGFMRVLTPAFTERFAGRLVNIHPSLLPAFPGLHTHQRALEAGCKFAGATVHLVTADLDQGPILAQAVSPVLATDTADTLAARVLALEHQIYPRALAALFAARAALGRAACCAFVRQFDEAGEDLLIDQHRFAKHGGGAHPQAAVAIQRAVQHHGLERLTVPGGVKHLVQATFVVAVPAGRHGCKRGKRFLLHGTILGYAS
jgi:hypothetical protein